MKYDFSAVAAYMNEVVIGKHHVPGCDMLIKKDHETIWRYTTGLADPETGAPLPADALYYMYSCTKPLTVTLGMRLYEEGKLELDAPVARYLPAFADVFLLRDGKRVPPEHTLTVRNLFTMTGGFDYSLGSPETRAVIREDPHADTRAIVDTFAKRPLLFEPGERFQYSVCHDILAAVIEVAAGERFSSYMKRVLFDPLGMKESTFDDGEAVHARIVPQFRADSATHEVTPCEKSNSLCPTDRYESGGAGLITSVEDYSAFADTLACDGQTKDGYSLLRPETVKLLRTEQLHSFVMNNNFSCAAGPGYGYGLGVRTRINQDEGQRSPIGEFGWDGAAGAYVMMDPVNHLSITFGMHVLNWPAAIGGDHAVMRDLIYATIEGL